jgi:type IV secretory pathway ATPase VirB11/archaellum biosynthesis ATPase
LLDEGKKGMPLSDSKNPCGAYEVRREGEEITLTIDCENCPFFPSIEDNGRLMSVVIDALAQTGTATRILLRQKRDYEYDFEQTQTLYEIAKIYKFFVDEKLRIGFLADSAGRRFVDARYAQLQDLIHGVLKSDPIAAYVELRRLSRAESLLAEQGGLPASAQQVLRKFVNFVTSFGDELEKTRLIAQAKPYLPGFRVGDRSIYRRIFTPTMRPDFMYTKLMAQFPAEGEELDSYSVGNTDVTIFSMPDSVQYLYHILPAEFKLNQDKYELLDAARKILAEHKPKRSEFVDPERMRQVFANVGADLLDELSGYRGTRLRGKERDELVDIIVRYTVGFGLIESLLSDEKIQDISINSPMGRIPMFIVHQDFGDCTTNILPTQTESESWASKLRLISGRPLDEANPILDTELVLPVARARVATITEPLNPTGLAYSIRRHRDKPWTLPLFIKTKMMTPLAAGIFSFIIDGARTVLVAGTRSAGKSSLLGSVLVEIMRRVRIITIEDTLELPVGPLRDMGYNIQSMKVGSALSRGSTEVSADEGIRTTLRLGDSALIVGEVRSTEARALYEAMRVGALANIVAGTIHGDSPYGVFDRVVNDLNVPRTSFKATDIIIVANPVRSPDGLHRFRRVTQLTEVRKHWEEDPMREGGFGDLMKYDATTDRLEPTSDLIAGESEIIKSIAGSVKEWAGNWEAVWDNIQLRTQIKETIVNMAEQSKNKDILEAPFCIAANDQFHRISEAVREEVGGLDSKRILFEWQEWARNHAKRA